MNVSLKPRRLASSPIRVTISWTATFSSNPVVNKKGRFTIQDLSGGKTIIVERNGDRGLKAGTIADGTIVYLNAMWNTAGDNYIIWGVPKQPSSNTGDWTILTADNQSNFTIAKLLEICGSANSIEIKVEGDNWGTITLIPVNNNEVAWQHALTQQSSSTTITVSKTDLQSMQNLGFDKVFMQNPASSVQARPVQ